MNDETTMIENRSNGLLPTTQSNTSELWQIGTPLFADYIIDGILGKGGIGTVYRVRRLSDQELFAVKTMGDWTEVSFAERQALIRELRTWLELPLHPNITTCRFYRSIDHRICIFSDYLSGGSLRSWIYQHKFPDLASRLDSAIQIARGLKVAHDHGIIHFDVKPANVLMTPDGIAKLTDFGLSRSNPMFDGIISGTAFEPNSFLTDSAYGMTIAYSSPEQAGRQPMTHQTDIWSFGVSLIELLTGDLPINQGFLADFVLDQMDRDGRISTGILPIRLRAIIRGCLQRDTSTRFDDMGDIADRLIHAYRAETGRAYHRPSEAPTPRRNLWMKPLSRETGQGNGWSDPKEWYMRAYANNHSASLTVVHSDDEIQKGLASFSDLELFHAAQELYQTADHFQQLDTRLEFSAFLLEFSRYLQFIGDFSGSNALLDLACGHLAYEVREPEAIRLHLEVIDTMARSASISGDHARAESLYERGLELLTRPSDPILAHSRRDAARFLTNLGIVKTRLSKRDQATKAFRSAQTLLNEDRTESGGSLLSILTDYNLTLALQPHAPREIFLMRLESIIAALKERNRPDEPLDHYIASAEMFHAFHGSGLLDNSMIIEQIRDASARLTALVDTGRDEFLPQLARIHMMGSSILRRHGDLASARTAATDALAILERLVRDEGRSEWMDLLATGHHHLGQVALDLGDNDTAAASFFKAEGLIDHPSRTGRTVNVIRMLISVRAALAGILLIQGRLDDLIALSERHAATATHHTEMLMHPDCFPEHARLIARIALMFAESGMAEHARPIARSASHAIHTVLQSTPRSDLTLLRNRLAEAGLWELG